MDCVYTGTAIGHNVVMTVFGGMVPTIATALYAFRNGRHPVLPFLYISGICAMSLGAHFLRVRDHLTSDEPLRRDSPPHAPPPPPRAPPPVKTVLAAA